jgi:hypothetical protein
MFVPLFFRQTTHIGAVRMRVCQETSLGPLEYIFGSVMYASFIDQISLYGYSTTLAHSPRQNGDTYPIMEQALYLEDLKWLNCMRNNNSI